MFSEPVLLVLVEESGKVDASAENNRILTAIELLGLTFGAILLPEFGGLKLAEL